MNNPGQLKLVLYALGTYLAILGLLFLFSPSIAESVMGISLPDAVLTPLYGQVVVVLALMAFMVARNVEQHAELVIVFIVEQVLHIILFVYFLVSGLQTFAQVASPLMIAVIFLALLWLYRR